MTALDQQYPALKAAWEQNPTDIKLCMKYSQILLSLGRSDEAITLLTNALDKQPNNRKLTLYLCLSFRRAGQMKSALDLAQTIARMAPKDVDGLKLLATIYQMMGALTDAQGLYRQYLELNLTSLQAQEQPAPVNRFDPVRLTRAATQILASLAAHNIHAFATGGLLLGMVRNGAILPNDKDVDIGLPWHEMDQAISLLSQNGWRELDCSSGLINPRTFIHNSIPVPVDLYGFAADDQSSVTGLWSPKVPPHWNRMVKFPELNLHLVSSEFGEHWAIKDPESWLESEYGPDWHIPDPDFQALISAHNLQGFSQLSLCYALMRLCDATQNGNLTKARRILSVIRSHYPADPLYQTLEKRISEVLA